MINIKSISLKYAKSIIFFIVSFLTTQYTCTCYIALTTLESVIIYDISNPQQPKLVKEIELEFYGHQDRVVSHPANKNIFSVGCNYYIQIFDITKKTEEECIETVTKYEPPDDDDDDCHYYPPDVQCLFFHPTIPNTLVSATKYNAKIWDWKNKTSRNIISSDDLPKNINRTFFINKSNVFAILFKTRFSGKDYEQLRFWNISQKKKETMLLGDITLHANSEFKDLNCQNSMVLATSQHNEIEIYNIPRNKKIKILDGHTNGICYAQLDNAIKQRAVSSSFDNTMKVWDIEKATCSITFKKYVNNPEFHPDQENIIISHNPKIRFWGMRSGKCIKTFGKKVNKAAFLPGKKNIIASLDKDNDDDDEKSITFWDTKNGKSIGQIKNEWMTTKRLEFLSERTENKLIMQDQEERKQFIDKDFSINVIKDLKKKKQIAANKLFLLLK